MSEKRFKLNDKGSFILEDGEPLKPLGKVVDLLNDFSEEKEQLQTQLLLCQQSQDGRFQVWEEPPIPQEKRISFTTNNDGGDGMIIYHIWELHNGVEPRLRMAYTNKRTAHKKVIELNNRDKRNSLDSKYYMKEFEVYED